MKKKITKLDDFGRGITYINDKICFVDNSLEGLSSKSNKY